MAPIADAKQCRKRDCPIGWPSSGRAIALSLIVTEYPAASGTFATEMRQFRSPVRYPPQSRPSSKASRLTKSLPFFTRISGMPSAARQYSQSADSVYPVKPPGATQLSFAVDISRNGIGLYTIAIGLITIACMTGVLCARQHSAGRIEEDFVRNQASGKLVGIRLRHLLPTRPLALHGEYTTMLLRVAWT